MEKVAIRAIKAFYRNDALIKKGDVIKDVPQWEAAGYVSTKKAEYVAVAAAAKTTSPAAPPAKGKEDAK